ncbi:MAG: D-alanyl-D-alanine carboxypeptidase/D-alanyl-D-alanine-endopeptidase [Bacteroidales bacterium]|nr:D-alanyl-D-alanine carboxypeptidase/D-alanyl-D-alanine-endopeptidase [Bacteroidales bacterium]
MIIIKKSIPTFLFFVFIICCVYNTGNAQNQIGTLNNIESSFLSNASVGISIKKIKNDSVIYDYNGNKNLIPASVLKLVTAYCILEQKGADYTFKTSLQHTGIIKQDTLWGNLIIKGGNDMSLGSRYFYTSTDIVFKNIIGYLGFKVIMGDIIVDISRFDNEYVHPTWTWQDLGNYYGCGVYGLSFLDNSFEIKFNANGKLNEPAQINSINPSLIDISIDNDVCVGLQGSGDNAYLYGYYNSKTYQAKGSLAKRAELYTLKGSLPNPPLLFAEMFRNYITSNGYFVKGKALVSNDKIADTVFNLGFISSPPLKELIKNMNEKSNNMFAEHFFKEFSADILTQGSFDKSATFVKQFLTQKVKNSEQINVVDGSGLSRFNTISAEVLTSILVNIANGKNYRVFKESLAVSGKTGTLSSFGVNSALNGAIYAKTGSMTRVRSLAGYIKAKSGSEYAFSIIINNFNSSHADIRKWTEDFLLQFYLNN